MKHVNLSPDLERKKAKIAEVMERFRQNDADDSPAPMSDSIAVQPPQSSKPSKPAPPVDDAPPSGEVLKARVIEALKEIYDPEIPVNIYDLGLIYSVDIKDGFAAVEMTLTTPGCPVAQTFPGMVESAVKNVAGVADATVDLVWDPPWTQARISEAARLELGLI